MGKGPGRGHGQLRINQPRSTPYTHRIAWELSRGPIPEKMLVLHSCDNPPCCRPDHLFLGTNADNTHDAIAKGRLACGSRHYLARVTEAQVVEIRELAAAGTTRAELASRFGLGYGGIRSILERKSWKHVAEAVVIWNVSQAICVWIG